MGKWENHRKTHRKMEVYPLVNVYIANWKDPPFSMAKSTISMAVASIANCNKLPEGNYLYVTRY